MTIIPTRGTVKFYAYAFDDDATRAQPLPHLLDVVLQPGPANRLAEEPRQDQAIHQEPRQKRLGADAHPRLVARAPRHRSEGVGIHDGRRCRFIAVGRERRRLRRV